MIVSMRILVLGSVPMKRVKCNAKLEHENIQNFKILQNAFRTVQVDKVSYNVMRERMSKRKGERERIIYVLLLFSFNLTD